MHAYQHISFLLSPNRYTQETGGLPSANPLATFKVTLDELSPFAQRLALGILTTNPASPLSYVGIRLFSPRQRLEQEMEKFRAVCTEAGFILLERFAQKSLSILEYSLGPLLDDRRHQHWLWDPLDDETPAAYLERHATAIQEAGDLVETATDTASISWLTTQEVAQCLNVQQGQVYNLLRQGRFPSARKHGGIWLIHPADLENPSVTHRPVGYPKGRPRTPASPDHTETT